MKKNLIIALALLMCLLNNGCEDPGEKELQLSDARNGQAVEGALIFRKGGTVYRSNLYGKAMVSDADFRTPLTIHAKNYTPLTFTPSEADGRVELQWDRSRVNARERKKSFTRKDTLRGSYGPYRENNDLKFYELSLRVNPAEEYISGSNRIRFQMLKDDARIQLDLFENMNIDSILFQGSVLNYEQDFNAVFIDFPKTLTTGQSYEIDFHYSGHPQRNGRFGGLSFLEDSLGNPWIVTACQGIGASLWWPNKDQQPDEVDSMIIRVAVPAGLVDVSNGRFMGKTDLGDGFVRYDWKVHYPINNYSVSLNIGKYVHFGEKLGDLTLDYFVQPYHLEAAQRQFAQTRPMMVCFEKYFGPYPFPKDGFKLVEVPYSGMEHQSAVTYGNLFKNGYLNRDWTGVGISTRFDFIIVHESGHEWYGNSITANDVSDAWIQEGWCTYTEGVYVECMFGYEDAMKYFNGYTSKVRNQMPIIGPSGVNNWPPGDQYFKGAIFLNTLRHVVDDDEKWWALIRAYTDHFKYQNIWTTDVINFFNGYLKTDLRPVFEQYLYFAALPVLQYRMDEQSIKYRWQANVADFDMPLKLRAGNGEMLKIHPSGEWQQTDLADSAGGWTIATDLFYIDVEEVIVEK